MGRILEALDELVDNLIRCRGELDEASLESGIRLILGSGKVFVYGAGRSGWVGRAFAQRLMQVGLRAFYVGEATTPGLEEGDTLVVISGTGKTASTLALAQRAKELGGRILAVTSRADSPLGSLADSIIHVEGRTKGSASKSLMPLSTIFLTLTQAVLDAIVVEVASRLGATEASLLSRHANIE